ncbi:hypothetical protein [Clostridium perfringens]|uniref:hypothetical protein n=1 Tax=Clostridium perfringens TaxID=1502 RepID=UPI0024BD47EF|nr:hypothetical protein [Clostridium perfringens]
MNKNSYLETYMDCNDLMNLNAKEIKEYFENNNITKLQLIDFMENNNIPYKKNMTLNKIVEYLSSEIESYGIYNRIAAK